VRDGFGADRLPGTWRTGEIEGKREAGGMALAQAPPVEDQIVLRHLRERAVERPPCRRRQDHIVEGAPRRDRLERATAADAEQTCEGSWRHGSTVLSRPHGINPAVQFGTDTLRTLAYG